MVVDMGGKMDLSSRVQACMMGVAIGDAMGMPVEMMTPEEIKEKVPGGQVTGFIDSIQRRIKDTQEYKAGTTTDDWQLTKVVAESLIRCEGYDQTDMMMGHIRALESTVMGWGASTRVGIEQVRDYFDSRGTKGRHPSRAPEATINAKGISRGCGNGVAMKIAPFAIMLAIRYRAPHPWFSDLAKTITSLGMLTHPDPRATITAISLAKALVFVLNNPSVDSTYLLDSLIHSCKSYESGFYDGRNQVHDADTFTSRLEKLKDNDLLLGPIEKLREVVGTSCFAPESVCFAIAVYLRNKNDFRAGILEAVNSGGDSDSTASMAGALIGSVVGLEGIPEEWHNFTSTFLEAAELGQEMLETFYKEPDES